jgi:hypothetical protein
MGRPARLPRGWAAALLLSLLLHALLLWLFSGLPGGRSDSRAAAPPDGLPVDPSLLDSLESCEPVAFLTRPRRQRSAPALATTGGPEAIQVTPSPSPPEPSPQAPATTPMPVPAGPAKAAGPTGQGGGPGVTPGAPPVGTGQGPGGTSFFGIAAKADRVVYVIDRSGSMAMHGALQAAGRELLASLARLPESASFQVIVYNSSAGPLLPARPGWLRATPENLHIVALALRRLEPEGSTKHDLAVPLALALGPDAVFFLTDADDLTAAQVRTFTGLNRGRAAIHAVELTGDNVRRPEMPLQTLARQNRGAYRAIDLEAAAASQHVTHERR